MDILVGITQKLSGNRMPLTVPLRSAGECIMLGSEPGALRRPPAHCSLRWLMSPRTQSPSTDHEVCLMVGVHVVLLLLLVCPCIIQVVNEESLPVFPK